MAIINQKTGYFGFTVEGLNGPAIDGDGKVQRAIFSIRYPVQPKDIDFTISSGTNDWAAQMGDGSIIPLSSPVVLYQNRDNSVVQFTLASKYPSNSPCILMYQSDTARISITKTSGQKEFTANSYSGHFGMVTFGLGGSASNNGESSTILVSIPYTYRRSDVDVSVSDDPSHWGALMGDGSIINLRNPVVVRVNRDNAVLRFTMDRLYPTNSPCILVYRSKDAYIHIQDKKVYGGFIGVTDIDGIPSSVLVGESLHLPNTVTIFPYNATNKDITWKVLSSNASISENDLLTISSRGTIVLEATIPNGIAVGTPYVKQFSIDATPRTITITKQPSVYTKTYVGNPDGISLSVEATIPYGELTYQWYQNIEDHISGGILVDGGNTSTLTIQNDKSGKFYYYCVISSDGIADAVTSTISSVDIISKMTGISIDQENQSVVVGTVMQLTTTITPDSAEERNVVWSSSNQSVVAVTNTGMIQCRQVGSAIITVQSVSNTSVKDSIQIISTHLIPVTDITLNISELTVGGRISLPTEITPANATFQAIEWKIIDDDGTNSVINDDGTITANSEGNNSVVGIRAIIRNGIQLNVHYTKDFYLKVVDNTFVEVTDVDFSPVVFNQNEDVIYSLIPSSYKISKDRIRLSVIEDGGTGISFNTSINTITALHPGVAIIQITIPKGKSETEDYVENVSLTVLLVCICEAIRDEDVEAMYDGTYTGDLSDGDSCDCSDDITDIDLDEIYDSITESSVITDDEDIDCDDCIPITVAEIEELWNNT